MISEVSANKMISNEEEEDESPPPPPPRPPKKARTDDSRFHGSCLTRQMYKPKLPYPAWDMDWDGRHKINNHNSNVNGDMGQVHHIFLIRHGQYEPVTYFDTDPGLTPLGRKQAEYTGQRLASMMTMKSAVTSKHSGSTTVLPCNFTSIYTSDMKRAKETAYIIASQMGCGATVKAPDPMLNEAFPCPSIPAFQQQNIEAEIDAHKGRVEKAFAKYIHRCDYIDSSTSSSSKPLSPQFTVLVGHGNVFRYFLCRALQIPPETWMRFTLFNCSLTYIQVDPDGHCYVRLVGDTGHIPYQETSYGDNRGYNF